MNRFRTLKTKLLYFSILISCLLTFLLSLVEIRHDMAEYNTFVQKEFSRFKETHLLYLADKIWAMEYKDLKKYSENEVQEQWFDSIRIYDIQGSVIATAGTQEPRSPTKKFDLTYHHNDKDVTIGSISLSATTPLFKNVVKERWKSVFAVNGLLVIFIFFCSYLFLEKLVLSRLKEIIAQTKDTNRFHSLKGNPLKISPRTNDEIDLLIKTMNMSSKQLYEELTKRKETEASLKFQAMLLDNIQDHVTATDINGKILYINKAEVKSTMRPKSELLQQSVEIYGEDNTRGVTQKEIIENTLKNGKWRGEVINYNASGDEIVMDCRTQVIFDDNGNPSQLVGISTDITDQKRFETEKGFLVTAIEQAAETILVTDAKGNIKYANSAFEKLTGYSREDVINKNPKILKSGNHDSVFYERLWNTISSGKVWKGEITNRNKEGNSFIEEATISPVRDKNGEIVNYVAVKHDITALRKTEQKLQHLVSNISDVIVILDQKGVVTYKSPNIKEHFGWDPDEFVGKNGFITVHPDDRDRIKKEFEILLKTTEAKVTVEYNYRCKDGRYKPVELTAVNMVNDPLINGVLANYKDITERKNFMEALHKSEEMFRLAFLTSPDAINLNWVEDGVYIEINEGFTKIMGYSRQDVIGRSSLDLNIWKNKKDRERLVEGLQKDGVVENLEAEFISKDGVIKTGLMSARVLKLEDESIILSITRDISDRKTIEQKLIKSEEQYREYFEENLSGSYISTPDGHLIACNQEYLKIFGFQTKEEALNVSIFHIFEKPEQRVDFINTIKNNQRVISRESKFKRTDGTLVTVVENASGLFDTDGNLKHIRGFLLNISEQRRLEAQIQQTQKMETIGRLAGGIAHDFNNILFPVLGHTEMLLDDIPSDSPLKGGVDEIYSSALRAKELVKQILTFSRQEQRELKLFKIQPVIKEVLSLIRSTIPTTIDIVQNIEKDCGPIKADPTQIHQVIMNVATNAYHAMENNGGEMRVELKEVYLGNYDLTDPDMKPGLYACLLIKDTGTGVKKEILDKIFDPFFTTKEKGKGTGMGLSVVHGIIKSLNGGIQVHSHHGKGTEFHIYIPVHKNTNDDETNKQKVIIGGNEHILFVDDETSIVTMQQQLLTRLGYQVTTFTNSIEALEAFRKHPDQFDLVITDLAMPKMPGDQLAEEILRLKSDMKILLCTGFSDKMTSEHAKAIGIKRLLEKPIVKYEIANNIRKALDE